MSRSRRVVLQHVLPDGVHQVGLAESDAAVDEERVVGARRRFRHRAAGRVRELVRRSDDEGVERVARVQAACAWPAATTSAARCRPAAAPRERRRTTLPPSATNTSDCARTPNLGQRLRKDDGVVLGEPVLEERIGNPDVIELPPSATKAVGLNQV